MWSDKARIGTFGQKRIVLAFGQAAGDDDPSDLPGTLELKHLVDRFERFFPGVFDESAGVDDHKVRFLGILDQLVATLLEDPEHLLAIDEIFRTSQTDKRVSPPLPLNAFRLA
jgi:hypothetical protein